MSIHTGMSATEIIFDSVLQKYLFFFLKCTTVNYTNLKSQVVKTDSKVKFKLSLPLILFSWPAQSDSIAFTKLHSGIDQHV